MPSSTFHHCLVAMTWHHYIVAVAILVLARSQPSIGRREAIGVRHGAVAADDRRCSKIGRDALREGGNAVDAAVAAALCLGVVGPASSGIGGGAFMLVRLASSGKAVAYDMRETAPLLSSENMYKGNASLKAQGGLSVAVPGELAGLYEAWKRHGKLPWARLVGPAEKLARSGFKLSPYLHFQLVSSEDSVLGDKGLSAVFASNGTLKNIGDLCRNPKLAQTLNKISKLGPKAFYNGTIGLDFVKDVQSSGGIITMKDLQTYKVKVHKPISGHFSGFELLAMPPPSGGPPLILMLNILSRYGLPSGINGSLGVHRMIEALKYTFALRMNLGDPSFINVSKVISDMLSPEFAEVIRKKINDNETFDSSHYGAKWNQVFDHGTSHLSVVDSENNAVSMTTTVNWYFGSKILSPRTGIVLNNEMDDFSIPGVGSYGSLPPPSANYIRPGKRPLSSMSPIIILKDNQLKAVLGASGGSMIFSAVGEIILNHFGRGLSPLSSIMAPRIYHQLMPNVVKYENWTTVTGDHFEVPRNIREDLEKKGHVLVDIAGGTICQLIVENSENPKGHKSNTAEKKFRELVAVSDPRKGGLPSGF